MQPYSRADACQSFLTSPLLSPRLKNIIDNIELIHRCSEETTLECELRQKAKSDPLYAKILRVDHSQTEFDSDDDIEFFANNNIQDPDKDLLLQQLNPVQIIRLGLNDINMVNVAMNYL